MGTKIRRDRTPWAAGLGDVARPVRGLKPIRRAGGSISLEPASGLSCAIADDRQSFGDTPRRLAARLGVERGQPCAVHSADAMHATSMAQAVAMKAYRTLITPIIW
jgi:hypothetical protein